jgi:hypothetical protein
MFFELDKSAHWKSYLQCTTSTLDTTPCTTMLALCLNIMKSLLALDSHISYTDTCAKFCCKLHELYLDQVDAQIEKLEIST